MYHVCRSQKNTFTSSLHSKAIEGITTWKSHVCSVFGVLSQSFGLLKVQTDSQVSLFEVLLKCVISGVWCHWRCPVWSGHTSSIICSICCTEHQPLCIIWLRELAGQGAEIGSECTCFLPGENLCHFLHSNVVYSCSFLAVVSFSNLLLLQNTHMQLS